MTASDQMIADLARGVLKGWLKYPAGRSPASCREDGKTLLRALAEGDAATIARLGVKGLGRAGAEGALAGE
jgi:hypothetical protein